MKTDKKPYKCKYAVYMPLNPRKARLLEELPKHNWKVKPAAIKAGYSESYADSAPKTILRSALKAQGQALIETATPNKTITSKEMKGELAQSIGLSTEEVKKALKNIALNERDFASALKVLSVIAKADLDFHINPDEAPKITVPILNIGVRQLDNGSTEPLIEQ